MKKVFTWRGVRRQVLECEWCEVLPQRESRVAILSLRRIRKVSMWEKSTMKGYRNLKMVRKVSMRGLAKLFRV